MNLPETMRAMVLTGHGGLDKFEHHQNWPAPVPAVGELLLRVGACGLNHTDINTRTAWYSKSITEGITDAGGRQGFDSAEADNGSWGGASISFPRIQGADQVIDRNTADLEGAIIGAADGQVDVALDVVGGKMFMPLINSLRQGFRYSTSGAISGPMVEFDLRQLKPLLARASSLENLGKAQEMFMLKQHVGNIVVET